jgi:hypothetical protein
MHCARQVGWAQLGWNSGKPLRRLHGIPGFDGISGFFHRKLVEAPWKIPLHTYI